MEVDTPQHLGHFPSLSKPPTTLCPSAFVYVALALHRRILGSFNHAPIQSLKSLKNGGGNTQSHILYSVLATIALQCPNG